MIDSMYKGVSKELKQAIESEVLNLLSEETKIIKEENIRLQREVC